EGIVFMASNPLNDALLNTDLVVMSIYGSNDGLISVDRINESQEYLPTDARFVEIVGGNHAQFGYYGEQGGDNPATITREEQIAQIVDATLSLLTQISSQ